jgi:hypothetical protein
MSGRAVAVQCRGIPVAMISGTLARDQPTRLVVVSWCTMFA